MMVLSIAVLATVGMVLVTRGQTGDANRRIGALTRSNRSLATTANRLASIAAGISITALHRLQAEANGECYRVNYMRWQIDHATYGQWRLDYIAARFLQRLPVGPIHRVGGAFHFAARTAHFLPLTDCGRATTSPADYRAPTAIPFNLASRQLLRRVLSHPPQPPERGTR
ncbi:MAG: hypothetical protein LC685_04385 [Actinobacteria bacterium]|nr:hypothetical protein [Actinomycetota bacterium]